MIKRLRHILLIALLLLLTQEILFAQDQNRQNNLNTTWLILQSVPSLTWTAFPNQTNFAFEWEATPIIYSWGMNRLSSRWNFLNPTQPQRFAGSLEINVSAQLFTTKAGSSHWGYSGQILSHFPLIEKGENLGLNLGIARYSNSLISSNYFIAGFSTLFGFLHYNIKYSPSAEIWIHAIEFRFF